MKNTFKTKATSLALAVLMIVSAFTMAVPAFAETTALKATPQILWSADFDGATSGLQKENDSFKGNPTQSRLSAPTNGDGILPLWKNENNLTGTGIPVELLYSGRLAISGVTFNDFDPSKVGTDNAAYNDFFNLMYGRTENTSYYMELDFIPQANDHATNPTHLYNTSGKVNEQLAIGGYTDEQIAALYNYDSNGDGVKDTFVNYKVDSYRRGPSYFTFRQEGYNELFKISPKGYVYGVGGTSGGVTVSSVEGTSKNSVNDWNEFYYTRYTAVKKDGKWQWQAVSGESNKKLSASVVDTMRSLKGEDFTLSWGNALVDYSKAYKIEPFNEYKIRIEISVDKDKSKVTYTTYIRENIENTPWFKVGERTLGTLFGDSGTRGTDFPKSLRITEATTAKPVVDNWFFSTFPADCSDGHITPVIVKEYDLEGYQHVYQVKCDACGQMYFMYDKAEEAKEEYVFNCDFTKMTQAEFNAFNAKFKALAGTFVPGTGWTSPKGEALWLSRVLGAVSEGTVKINRDEYYEVGFTVNFEKFAASSAGTSFFTDSTMGWQWLLRYGTTDIDTGATHNLTDEASTSKVWIKMYGPTGSTKVEDDTATPYARYLETGKDYKFVLRFFNNSTYDVLVGENGGELVSMSGGKCSKHSLSGYENRSFRIFDNRAGSSFVLKDWYVKTTYDPADVCEAEYYDVFDETKEGWSVDYNSALVPMATEELGFFVGNGLGNAANSYLTDKELAIQENPYSISFDFMLTENGKVNENPTGSGNQFWSLLTWQGRNTNNSDSYGAIISIGALDTDGDGVFDKHFLLHGADATETFSLVAESAATEDEKKNHYVEIGGVKYYFTDKNAIYELEVGKWINLSVTLDGAYNVAHVYVNGEHVSSRYVSGVSQLPALGDYSLKKSQLRFGDGFGRRFLYAYALKNVEVIDDGGYFGNQAGTLAFYNDLGSEDRIIDNNWSELGEKFASRNVKITVDPTIGDTKYSQVLDTETAQGYTRYIAKIPDYDGGSSKMYDLSKSVKNIFSGEYVDLLSGDGSKYSVKLNFAIPNRTLTAQEVETFKVELGTDGKTYPYANFTEETTTLDLINKNNPSILRLSKWHDNNQIRLLFCNPNGLFNNSLGETGGWYFCDAKGNIYNPISELDENGRPLKITSVEAVIDEWNNTYTLYIDGELAYRKNGLTSTTIIPAADMPMKLQYGANSLTKSDIYGTGKTYAAYADVYKDSPEYKAWEASGGAYAAIPHHLTVTTAGGETQKLTHTNGDWRNNSYIRFFQATYDFIVESVEINKIRDSRIEYIGSQVKKESESQFETSFDLRFVFGVDDTYVDGLYYNVTGEINNDGEGEIISTDIDSNVYSSIVADGETINAYRYYEGNYFSVFKIEGVEVTDADNVYTFTISPYTRTAKGDRVPTGDTYKVQYNGLGEYIGCALIND